jgi:transposase
MITLVQKQKIIIDRIQRGKSQRTIARELGISRNTVRKYLKAYRQALKKLQTEDSKVIDKEEIIEEIVQKPVYNRNNPHKPKMLPAIEQFIDQELETNKQRKEQGIYKQLLSIKEIHEELTEAGYDIGYTSVRNYIRNKDTPAKEAFIRQQYTPAEAVEFDWGEIKLFLDGAMRKIQVAVFVSAYSNDIYAVLFYRQNTESFLQAHADYLDYLGGSPRQMVYDNMRVAVKRLAGSEKEPTEALLKLATYYSFDFRFCNIRKGNEKGHVENGVKVIETKVFSRNLEFETLGEAQAFLNQRLVVINRDKQEKLTEDRAAVRHSRPKMELGILQTRKVDKYATVSIDTNHYSVPDQYAQKAVKVKLYPKKLIIYDIKTNKKVGRHERSDQKGVWQMEITHYLKTLKRKPGAIANSVALDQAQQQIKTIYKDYFTRKPKEFIDLLYFMDKENVSVEQVCDGIDTLKRKHHREITADKIQLICLRKEYTLTKESPIEDLSRQNLKAFSEMFS